jgi:hypothetical protein
MLQDRYTAYSDEVGVLWRKTFTVDVVDDLLECSHDYTERLIWFNNADCETLLLISKGFHN